MNQHSNSISVAMCTFNGERYLREQLESIANQSRAPHEIVVCDDQSSDATVDIVREFAASAQFPVRIEFNPQRLGSTKNFERAISLCAGDIIALADQDDLWVDTKLERLQSAFQTHEDVGLVFSDAELIDDANRPLGHRLWEQVGLTSRERSRLHAGKGIWDLIAGATVTGATMALRAQYRMLILPIPIDLPMIHDGWISLMSACVARVIPIEEALVRYRQHSRQQVGAQERMSAEGGLSAVATGHAREALNRKNPYESALKVASAARTRLVEKGEPFGTRAALATLDGVIRHLQARSALPESTLARTARVARELLTLRYFRFSNGVSSAAKDLLSGDRSPTSG